MAGMRWHRDPGVPSRPVSGRAGSGGLVGSGGGAGSKDSWVYPQQGSSLACLSLLVVPQFVLFPAPPQGTSPVMPGPLTPCLPLSPFPGPHQGLSECQSPVQCPPSLQCPGELAPEAAGKECPPIATGEGWGGQQSLMGSRRCSLLGVCREVGSGWRRGAPYRCPPSFKPGLVLVAGRAECTPCWQGWEGASEESIPAAKGEAEAGGSLQRWGPAWY